MGVSPFRWHQLHAACIRRYAHAESAVDVEWEDLPTVCNGTHACNFTTVTVWNHRPIVSTVNTLGSVSGVVFPGNLQADWWHDKTAAHIGMGKLQHRSAVQQPRRFHRSNLIQELRIVRVHNAVISPSGAVIAGRWSFGHSALRRCELDLPRLPASRTCLGPVPSAIVIAQRWVDSFSHIFFQLLPQLVLLLEHSGTAQAAPKLFLGQAQSYSSPSLGSILKSAFNLPPTSIVRSLRNEAHFAEEARLLYLPPASCANTAIFGHAVLRRAHQTLAQLAYASSSQGEAATRGLVVYFQRKCPAPRCIANEREMLRRIERHLIPPFELRVVNTGDSHVQPDLEAGERMEARAAGVAVEPGSSYTELRHVMSRARVIIGACGSAWGNMAFAPALDPDTSFIEINWLYGRATFVKLHHYLGGGSRYWVLEPTISPWAARTQQASQYTSSWFAPIGELIVALKAAGVAHCESPMLTQYSDRDEPPRFCNMTVMRESITYSQ